MKAGCGHAGRTPGRLGPAVLTVARPVGRCALVTLAVLLTYGPTARAHWVPPQRRFAAVWAGRTSLSGRIAAACPASAPPRHNGTIVHHGSRSVAAAVVLIERSRRVNLSRLGGLQGP